MRDPEAIDEAVLSSHRRNGTDPWEANASRIARLPDLEVAYLTLAAENATLRASEAAALERESDMRQALQAAMGDIPGWYDLARDARNASLSARTQRMIARAAITPTADKEPKT